MRFQDAVAVVTGSAVGIGQAALVAFAREGARVVLVDKDLERAQPVVDQLGQDGHDVFRLPGDWRVHAEAPSVPSIAFPPQRAMCVAPVQT